MREFFTTDRFPGKKSFKKGEIMFHQGDPVGGIHIVQDGMAKEFLTDKMGNEFITGLATRQNPILLGLEGVIDGEPHLNSAKAVIPVVTQYIPRREIHEALRINPKLSLDLLTYFATRVRQRTEKRAVMSFLDLQARLAVGLLDGADQLADFAENTDDLPEINHLTQEDLAAMIGGTRASVNKMLGSWEDRGLIKRVGRRIVVLKPYALKNVGANEAVLEPFPSVEESPKKTIVRERMTA